MRRSGVSTRIIDESIQSYFKNGQCLLFEKGNCKNIELARNLYIKFLSRLKLEHFHAVKYLEKKELSDKEDKFILVVNKQFFLSEFIPHYDNLNINLLEYESRVFEYNLRFFKEDGKELYQMIPDNEETGIFMANNKISSERLDFIDTYRNCLLFKREFSYER